jgi:T5orf172 domain
MDHGYVYAFEHRARGWLKIGMTDKNDAEQCWRRIENYAKEHSLPADGWEMVSFIPSPKAHELETTLHQHLSMFRVKIGSQRTELFYCGVPMLQSILAGLREFVEGAQAALDSAASETADQRLAREAHLIRTEQARIRKAIDDEWTVKGLTRDKYNKFQREREFRQRWRNHPVGQKQHEQQQRASNRLRAEQAAEAARKQRDAEEAAQARHRAAEIEAAEARQAQQVSLAERVKQVLKANARGLDANVFGLPLWQCVFLGALLSLIMAALFFAH